MKLSEYKKTAEEFSGLASERLRAVALGGIAIAWVFKVELDGKPSLPQGLILPLLFFGLSLFFDVLQYLVGDLIWTIFHRHHEKELDDVAKDDPDLDHSVVLPNIINSIFYLKITSVLIGYILLVKYIIQVY